MNLSRNIILSAEILTAHKLRTFLSVLGIVVGVGVVVLMVSAGKGTEKRVLATIRSMGSNLIVVNAGQTSIIAGRQRQMDVVRTLIPADAEAVEKECPSVARAAAATGKKVTVRWEDREANTTVTGMDNSALAVRSFSLRTGREFDELELRSARRVAILGPTAAANLFDDADPIGRQIRIGKVPFEVIGVTHAKGTDANGLDQDDIVIVPLQTAMKRLLNVTYVQTVYVQAKASDLLDAAEREIAELLRQRHRLTVRKDDFTIQNQSTLLAAERETTQSMTMLVASVAAISLLVGGVGILAVMLMAVRERTPEIGLRRALGARRQDIQNQFLIESGLLSGFGGGLGVAVGLALAKSASAFDLWEMVISWPAATLAFLTAVGMGVLFGLYPALRAARMEPIQALRSE
jgi:putative ABC transport system permease protein